MVTVLKAEIATDARVAEILKHCFVGEDAGVGFDGSANLSLEEMNDFKAWFKRSEDPLASINQFVSDESLRAIAVVVASATLDDDHFYQVSLNALQRYADAKAGDEELRRILMPDMDKRGLLSIHFSDEELRTILKKCLKRGISELNYENLINHILSGSGAKDVLEDGGNSFPARYVPQAAAALKVTEPTHGRPSSSDLEGDALLNQGDSPSRDSHGSWPLIGKPGLWLWLLAIPVILLIWFVLRFRK